MIIGLRFVRSSTKWRCGDSEDWSRTITLAVVCRRDYSCVLGLRPSHCMDRTMKKLIEKSHDESSSNCLTTLYSFKPQDWSIMGGKIFTEKSASSIHDSEILQRTNI